MSKCQQFRKESENIFTSWQRVRCQWCCDVLLLLDHCGGKYQYLSLIPLLKWIRFLQSLHNTWVWLSSRYKLCQLVLAFAPSLMRLFLGWKVAQAFLLYSERVSTTGLISPCTCIKTYANRVVPSTCISCNNKIVDYLMPIINPTMSFQVGNFKQLPNLTQRVSNSHVVSEVHAQQWWKSNTRNNCCTWH